MSTKKQVIQLLGKVDLPGEFQYELVKFLVSMVLELTSLFKGPFGYSAGPSMESNRESYIHWARLPTLQNLQAFERRSHRWILSFLEVCEESSDKQTSKHLLPLLKEIWNLKESWNQADPKKRIDPTLQKQNGEIQYRIQQLLRFSEVA